MKRSFLIIISLILCAQAEASVSSIFGEIEALGKKWESFNPCQKLFVLGYSSYREGSLNDARKYLKECDGEYPLLQKYITNMLTKIETGGERFSYTDVAAETAKRIKALERMPKTPENQYDLAKAYFKGRRFNDAAELFKKTSEYKEYRLGSLEYLATSLARLERYDEAILVHEEVMDLYPKAKETRTKALFKIGFLYLDSGHYEQAGETFERLQRLTPHYQKDQVSWYLAWCAYKSGKYKEAVSRFAVLEKKGSKKYRDRAEFWRGVSLEKEGNVQEAMSVFGDILAHHPSSYYGILASRKLKTCFPISLGDEDEEELTNGENNDPADIDGDVAGLKVAYELDKLGLGELVSQELSDYFTANKRKAVNWQEAYNLAKRNDSWDVVNRLARGRFSHDVSTKGQRWVLEGAYPKAYKHLINDATTRHKVEPIFAWSIMREESVFKPKAVSSSGAVGLMQLMPFTAERMLGKQGFSVEKILVPRHNIEAGVGYLGFLTKHYNNNLFYSAAAYNAGEEAVDRWLASEREELKAKGVAAISDEEFVEEIPYKETNDYVKKVMRSYWTYKEMYPNK